MSLTTNTKEAVECYNKGQGYDNANNIEDAIIHYKRSLELFQASYQTTTSPLAQKSLQIPIDNITTRLDVLQQSLQKINEKIKINNSNDHTPKAPIKKRSRSNINLKSNKKSKLHIRKREEEDNNEDNDDDDDDDDNAKLKKQLKSTILNDNPNVKLDDVIGLDEVKYTIDQVISIPLQMPHLYKEGKREPWKSILLYGPPGTGKTQLAKAVATETRRPFFSISSANIVSKWHGESERLVKCLFEMGREKKPCVIFIDEIDSLCKASSHSTDGNERRIVTEFLKQMGGIGSENKDILVIGATNDPWSIDEGIRRRFEKRIYIPLPDENARAKMIKLYLEPTPNTLTFSDIVDLSQKLKEYSGSDIFTLVKEAVMQPIAQIQTATHFILTPSNTYLPCSPDTPNAEKMTWKQMDGSKVEAALVCYNDFLVAKNKCKPTVAKESLNNYIKFTEKFGQDGT